MFDMPNIIAYNTYMDATNSTIGKRTTMTGIIKVKAIRMGKTFNMTVIGPVKLGDVIRVFGSPRTFVVVEISE